ncbi:uncharacterized protein MELLADRAFT_58574 [Melampsora larici-populina 98AG31]|uniref:Uncharacterized protein n=1 Tax=Melampsora larici-populina (strain 98AG31 / pathotype 3-4-7) TaxID=747676 RepID=F4R417_MELLP|nr:uncharacterized protein MELLADRAFT_58574 [Melampsora larici-populina 98AG31]EGG12722.1 hypothetical protein MELLADRAFT_58574 [Melampsora larici-populina 98AG31]
MNSLHRSNRRATITLDTNLNRLDSLPPVQRNRKRSPSTPRQPNQRRSRFLARQAPNHTQVTTSALSSSLPASAIPTQNSTSPITTTSTPNVVQNNITSTNPTSFFSSNISKPTSILETVPLPSLQGSEASVIVPTPSGSKVPEAHSKETQLRETKASNVGWICGILLCVFALIFAIGCCFRHKHKKIKKEQANLTHEAFWGEEGLNVKREKLTKNNYQSQRLSSIDNNDQKLNKLASEFEDDKPNSNSFSWTNFKSILGKPESHLGVREGKRQPRPLDTIQMEKKNREKVRSSLTRPPPIHTLPSALANQHYETRISNDLLDRGSFCPTAFDDPQSVVSYPLRCNGHLDMNSPPLALDKEGFGITARESYGHYALPPSQSQKHGLRNQPR